MGQTRKASNRKSTCARHLTIGWWSLLVFLSLGIVLEVLHGFKVNAYLSVDAETRRLMWRLAHAHGTLLSLVNIGFALTLRGQSLDRTRWVNWASRCLLGGTILLPVGFFLGGLFSFSGDPGLGILLVPVGALMLLVATLLTARGVTRHGDNSPPSP